MRRWGAGGSAPVPLNSIRTVYAGVTRNIVLLRITQCDMRRRLPVSGGTRGHTQQVTLNLWLDNGRM